LNGEVVKVSGVSIDVEKTSGKVITLLYRKNFLTVEMIYRE
jgi:hypothetical protein